MRPRIVTVITVLALVGATSCVRMYQPPMPTEPHATIKIRRSFETSAGTQLNESASVNQHAAQHASAPVAMAGAPRTSAILVHPIPAQLAVGGGFSHFETQMVTETYYVQVPYTAMETYSCGTGKSYQTCTRTVTQYRSESHTRTVPRTVEVSDGACAMAIRFSPLQGHIYVLDYTYRQNGVCSLTCLEQTAIMEDGSFRSAPCPAVTPAEAHAIDEALE